MSERKFTNEEIKEALECCCKTSGCDIRCPFSGRADRNMCVKYFLDLINCQQAEIEKRKTECVILTLEREMYKGGSVEAVKRFAERLKEKTKWCISERFVRKEIDNLVKEMVGEKDV